MTRSNPNAIWLYRRAVIAQIESAAEYCSSLMRLQREITPPAPSQGRAPGGANAAGEAIFEARGREALGFTMREVGDVRLQVRLVILLPLIFASLRFITVGFTILTGGENGDGALGLVLADLPLFALCAHSVRPD